MPYLGPFPASYRWTGYPRTEPRRSALRDQRGSMLTRLSSRCLVKQMSQAICIYTPKSHSSLCTHLGLSQFFVCHSAEVSHRHEQRLCLDKTRTPISSGVGNDRKKIDGPQTHSAALMWERVQAHDLDVICSGFILSHSRWSVTEGKITPKLWNTVWYKIHPMH